MHYLRTVTAVLALGMFAPVLVFGQSQSNSGADPEPGWEMPRLTDGQPDLQGYWTTQTFTPMERPEYLEDKAFYSEEEWAELQAQLTVDGADPLARFAIEIADPDERARVLDQAHRDETYVHYDNAMWLRTRVPKGLSTRRTSLVVDPPNGRIPPLNAQGQARADARRAARADQGQFDAYDLRPLSERCIYYGYNGPPLQPPSYNDIHQVFQTTDHLVISPSRTTIRRGSSRSTGGPPCRRRSASTRATPADVGRATRLSSRAATSTIGPRGRDRAAT